ncbi:hypothetical protein L596_017403 [Steinernema carpocapsae]|uniref:RING-type domain-containing protein n=1 Tax=Steinernema carpocapsae TaxID=34508 RepID=A0A4U5N1U2_STECR|nr:hypothetical protein L596_017403 [Steinernema carpocapsae]
MGGPARTASGNSSGNRTAQPVIRRSGRLRDLAQVSSQAAQPSSRAAVLSARTRPASAARRGSGRSRTQAQPGSPAQHGPGRPQAAPAAQRGRPRAQAQPASARRGPGRSRNPPAAQTNPLPTVARMRALPESQGQPARLQIPLRTNRILVTGAGTSQQRTVFISPPTPPRSRPRPHPRPRQTARMSTGGLPPRPQPAPRQPPRMSTGGYAPRRRRVAPSPRNRRPAPTRPVAPAVAPAVAPNLAGLIVIDDDSEDEYRGLNPNTIQLKNKDNVVAFKDFQKHLERASSEPQKLPKTPRKEATKVVPPKTSEILAFKKQITDEFKCNICQDLLYNPVVVTPCSHRYCSSCMAELLRQDLITKKCKISKCPECRGTIGFIAKDVRIREVLKSLVKAFPDLQKTEAEEEMLEKKDVFNGLTGNIIQTSMFLVL